MKFYITCLTTLILYLSDSKGQQNVYNNNLWKYSVEFPTKPRLRSGGKKAYGKNNVLYSCYALSKLSSLSSIEDLKKRLSNDYKVVLEIESKTLLSDKNLRGGRLH